MTIDCNGKTVVRPECFGATGNPQDDYDAIHAAITYAAKHGLSVVFKDGMTYQLNQELSFTGLHGLILRGRCTLKATEDMDTVLKIFKSTHSLIDGLTIDANNKADNCLHVSGFSYSKVKDLQLKNAKENGLYIEGLDWQGGVGEGCYLTTYQDIRAGNNTGHGFKLDTTDNDPQGPFEKRVNGNTFINCALEDNGGDGAYCRCVSGNSFIQTESANNGGNGFTFYDHCKEQFLFGGYIEGNMGNGIQLGATGGDRDVSRIRAFGLYCDQKITKIGCTGFGCMFLQSSSFGITDVTGAPNNIYDLAVNKLAFPSIALSSDAYINGTSGRLYGVNGNYDGDTITIEPIEHYNCLSVSRQRIRLVNGFSGQITVRIVYTWKAIDSDSTETTTYEITFTSPGIYELTADDYIRGGIGGTTVLMKPNKYCTKIEVSAKTDQASQPSPTSVSVYTLGRYN